MRKILTFIFFQAYVGLMIYIILILPKKPDQSPKALFLPQLLNLHFSKASHNKSFCFSQPQQDNLLS